METPSSPSHVVIAYDATKDRSVDELKITLRGMRVRGDILRPGDTLLVLGVLHRVIHPMGYWINLYPEPFAGKTDRAIEEEVAKKVDLYVNMLQLIADECEDEGVSIEVKITAGTPVRKVILQEVIECTATWLVLDRHLRRDLKFYIKQIPSKVALVQDSLTVEALRRHAVNETEPIEHKRFYFISKPVPLSSSQNNESNYLSSISYRSHSYTSGSMESFDMHKSMISSSSKSHEHSVLSDSFNSCGQYTSGAHIIGEDEISSASQLIQKQKSNVMRRRTLEAPILCAGCGTRTELYIRGSMVFNFSEIQLATNDFSKENLLGEGGYGYVYKGILKDGQLIAAKVRKEASTQGLTEFHSEVHILSFARHKNIVMLLGYCSKENLNTLVYEYICNKSLDWHLFDNPTSVLDWHQRRAITIGTAKGLRFLHEECRGGPIIHRDMRPSNILLTHDFVPMLGDFGLARWKTNDDQVETQILGTLGYLAPEYAENGFVSVRTDVYAFGVVLLQLISGRKVFDARGEENQSVREWAVPIIKRLALHELIDPRIGDSYDTYELYLMAKTAFLCVETSPEMRPSMAEVLRLLEGESHHFHHLGEQFVDHVYRK